MANRGALLLLLQALLAAIALAGCLEGVSGADTELGQGLAPLARCRLAESVPELMGPRCRCCSSTPVCLFANCTQLPLTPNCCNYAHPLALQPPFILYSGYCTCVQLDFLVCGKCGNVCPLGSLCVCGKCWTSADPSVNFLTDSNNCGKLMWQQV